MKVGIVYNRSSERVINLFGLPNQEKIGLRTIKNIADGLRKGGHTVRTFEGDKDLVSKLEDFMPRVISGELPGLVFNVSYGIQGQARYTHVPSILEMIGIPYVGSGPLAHSLALDKVVAKMIFQQHGIPTPDFAVLQEPGFEMPPLKFPLIVKPKNEAVSFGLRVVHNEVELREGADIIFEKFEQPVLVEQYIEGREINIGMLGNNPPETLPGVELKFGKTGPAIYTYEDKTRKSGREIDWECPAKIPEATARKASEIALAAFKALGCYDCCRVDLRLDRKRNLYVLEVNSLPSMGEHGSYTIAAQQAGLDFSALVCRLVEVASARYFGTPTPPALDTKRVDPERQIFSYLVGRRDLMERRLQEWTGITSRTSDLTGIREAQGKLHKFFLDVSMNPLKELTDERCAWLYETKAGMDDGILLLLNIDVPQEVNAPGAGFRREGEWLYGEGIGVSRAPMVMMQYALRALRSVRRLQKLPLGVMIYSDEGRDSRYSEQLIRDACARVKKVLVLRSGNVDNKIINQRRGWRKFKLTVSGAPSRLGKNVRDKDVLQWSLARMKELGSLSSKQDRVAVATSELRTEHFPWLLPHRVNATILMSYPEMSKADAIEKEMRSILADGADRRWELELVSDRPPMKKRRKNDPLLKQLKAIAGDWDMPLGAEASLYPSAAGLVPSSAAVVCGIGPIARDVDTPREAVLRISLMQRTLLLAQFLYTQVKK